MEGVLDMVSEEGTPLRFFFAFGVNNVGSYCIQIASVSASFIIHNIIVKFPRCTFCAFDTAL